MIYPKRLIEVDLPIKRISAHARREKSIRHGHISTLHTWWARRPLAACRAVICAALWPDPADELCPDSFRETARNLMLKWAKDHYGLASDESMKRLISYQKDPKKLDDNEELRRALLDFIADFANWDNSTVREYLDTSRALTQSAHEALGGEPGTRPLVVDPFAGGGSIPLEALRVGADAFASDLNPVAVLLNKVVLEYIPKYGQRLADEVRKWGQWIKQEAEKELGEFYPKDPDGATPIAYLWARTIQCEGPGCGAEVPLMRSLWLAKKPGRSIALKILTAEERREKDGDKEKTEFTAESAEERRGKKRIEFGIVKREARDWKWVELPPSLSSLRSSAADAAGIVAAVSRPPKKDSGLETGATIGVNPDQGTVKRGSATCPVCGFTTPVASVRRQLKPRRGGAADARLFAVVTTRPDQQGRFYRLPTERDLEATCKAAEELERRKQAHEGPLSLVPDEPLPPQGTLGFRVQLYGMKEWGDLFTPRQALALTTLARLVRNAGKKLAQDNEEGLAEAVQTCLALAVNRQTDYTSSLCSWHLTGEKLNHTFGRQALPMFWDFTEVFPFSGSSGDFGGALEWIIRVCEANAFSVVAAHAEHASAASHPLPDDSVKCFFTDPPYYDAVPYADLSDFFIVWLKRSVSGPDAAPFANGLSPKDDECIVDEIKGKDKAYFESTMAQAMAEGRRILNPAGVGVVVFAHKSTAGWEAQLQAMIDAGWTMTGSWPIDTEMGSRLRAMNSAALASSVHLVCRPRQGRLVVPPSGGSSPARIPPEGGTTSLPTNIGDWRDVLSELPKRIHDWMPRLASEGIVGADAIFACLGPALEIFSRYDRVEKASGEQVTLREYLEHVWAAVAREALTLIFAGADATGFEEDARLTAMWLWTLFGGKGNGAAEKSLTAEGAESAEEDEDQEETSSKKVKMSGGYVLEYDAARKIAQGIGAHLENLSRLVEVKGDKARLLPVSERTRFLFGKDEQGAPTSRGRKKKQNKQLGLFETLAEAEAEEGGWGEKSAPDLGDTILDRVHQSMILFASGRSEAMKRFIVEDGAGQDQRFWRLADALSALYPQGSEEKRWVDGVLARKKGLGF